MVSPPKKPNQLPPSRRFAARLTRFIVGPLCWFQSWSEPAENAGVKVSSHMNSQIQGGFSLFTPELVGADDSMSGLTSAIVVRRSALSFLPFGRAWDRIQSRLSVTETAAQSVWVTEADRSPDSICLHLLSSATTRPPLPFSSRPHGLCQDNWRSNEPGLAASKAPLPFPPSRWLVPAMVSPPASCSPKVHKHTTSH